jgi:hypothetical protein
LKAPLNKFNAACLPDKHKLRRIGEVVLSCGVKNQAMNGYDTYDLQAV